MDLGKNQSHLRPRQTPDLQQEKNLVPDVIGTWNLRNREQLRKRKAEAQEKQTSQWHFGEKKHKRQRTGKGNQRGRKRQHNTEAKVEPRSQLEKEMTEKTLAPAEKENELPGSVTEALCLVASPQRVVSEKKISAIGQESMIDQENSSECQHSEDNSITVQNHPSEIGQEKAEPGELSPKVCQEIAVIQDHSSKMGHDMAEPEDLSPKMCPETAVAKALPSKTYEDRADMEGCSLKAYPKPDVPKRYALEIYQDKGELKEHTAESGQGIAGAESFFPKTQQEIAVPKNLPPTKIYHETVEPDQFPHKAYTKEIAVPKAPSHKTIQEIPAPEEGLSDTCTHQETPGPEEGLSDTCTHQETPGPEEGLSDTCTHQETPGPEDLSTKTCRNKECIPEPDQEAGGPPGQHPKAHQEDVKDVFPPEMKGQPKAQEPETPVIPNLPQEIHPENDVYSYVLF